MVIWAKRENSGLIFFNDLFVHFLDCPQYSQESSLTLKFKSTDILFILTPTFTSIELQKIQWFEQSFKLKVHVILDLL